MPIRQRPTIPRRKDPREEYVQINVPVPRWYREQLYDYCDMTGKSFASVIMGPVLEKVAPVKPPKLRPWPPKHYAWEYSPELDEIEVAE